MIGKIIGIFWELDPNPRKFPVNVYRIPIPRIFLPKLPQNWRAPVWSANEEPTLGYPYLTLSHDRIRCPANIYSDKISLQP